MSGSSPGDIGPTKSLFIPPEQGVQYQSADLLLVISPPGSANGITYDGTSALDGKGIDAFYEDPLYDTVTPISGSDVTTVQTGLRPVYTVNSGTALFKLTSSSQPSLPPVTVAVDVPRFIDPMTPQTFTGGPPVTLQQNPETPFPSGVAVVFQDQDVGFSNITWQPGNPNTILTPLVQPPQPPPTTPQESLLPMKVAMPELNQVAAADLLPSIGGRAEGATLVGGSAYSGSVDPPRLPVDLMPWS